MNLYDYEVKNEAGQMVSLSEFRGKVLLIVNTATGCHKRVEHLGRKSNGILQNS